MRIEMIERHVPMMHTSRMPDSGGQGVPVVVELNWAAAAPWSVRVGFPGDGDGEQVSWNFGLDLLAAGLVRPRPGVAQDGPMQVWTFGEQREATVLGRVADTVERPGWLQARTSDLAEFLADALRAMAIRTATQ